MGPAGPGVDAAVERSAALIPRMSIFGCFVDVVVKVRFRLRVRLSSRWARGSTAPGVVCQFLRTATVSCSPKARRFATRFAAAVRARGWSSPSVRRDRTRISGVSSALTATVDSFPPVPGPATSWITSPALTSQNALSTGFAC